MYIVGERDGKSERRNASSAYFSSDLESCSYKYDIPTKDSGTIVTAIVDMVAVGGGDVGI